MAEAAQRRPGNRKSGGAGFSLGGVEKFFLIPLQREPRARRAREKGMNMPYRRSLSIPLRVAWATDKVGCNRKAVKVDGK